MLEIWFLIVVSMVSILFKTVFIVEVRSLRTLETPGGYVAFQTQDIGRHYQESHRGHQHRCVPDCQTYK